MMLISIIGNLVVSIGLLQGLCILRGKSFKNKWNILYVIMIVAPFIFTITIKGVKPLMFLLLIIIYIIDYYGEKESNIEKSIIRSIILISIFILSDIASYIIINLLFKFGSGVTSSIYYMILNYLLIFMLSKVFRRLIKDNNNLKRLGNYHKNKNYYIWINILLCIFAIYLNFKINKRLKITNRHVYLTNLILFSSAILSSIFTAYVFNKECLNELEMKIKSEEIKHIEEYAKHVEELYSNIRAFKHDYKNILLSLNEYIEEKRYDELEIYFKESILLSERNIERNDFIVKLKNIKILPLKSVLISKLMKANNNSIDIFIDIVEEIDSIHMDHMDSIRVFGILLDNAIEECVKTNDKKLNFAIVKKEKSTIFIIENSCRENTPCIYKVFENGFSTKGNNRGIGLYNLKMILNKYGNITLNMEKEKGFFKAEIWIREI